LKFFSQRNFPGINESRSFKDRNAAPLAAAIESENLGVAILRWDPRSNEINLNLRYGLLDGFPVVAFVVCITFFCTD
jgi:hypothetical protein